MADGGFVFYDRLTKNFLCFSGINSGGKHWGCVSKITFQLRFVPLKILGARDSISLTEVEALLPRTVLQTEMSEVSTASLCGKWLDL